MQLFILIMDSASVKLGAIYNARAKGTLMSFALELCKRNNLKNISSILLTKRVVLSKRVALREIEIKYEQLRLSSDSILLFQICRVHAVYECLLLWILAATRQSFLFDNTNCFGIKE